MNTKFSNPNFQKKISEILLGPAKDFSLKQRFIALICVFVVFGSLGFLIPAIISGTPLVGNVLTIGIILVAIVYYYLVRILRKDDVRVSLLIGTIQICLSGIYFYNSGINGTTLYAYIILVMFSALLPKRNLYIGSILTNILALLVLEMLNPELVVVYANRNLIFVDHLLSLSVTVGLLFFTINMFHKAYQLELDKNIRQNKTLQLQKEHIIQLSEKERNINEVKMNFFTNMSHEFRTPLSLIMTPVELLLDDDSDNSRQFHYRVIQKNMIKIQNLVDQVLNFRKIETGHGSCEFSKCNIISLIQNIYNSFLPMSETRDIKMALNLAIDKYSMVFDPKRIEIILNNILSNAFKFTPGGGKIEISVGIKEATRDKGVYISISDTGLGIPKEYQEEIFNPYFQLPGTKYGTGLGLAIAKQYAQSMNGTVQVESEPGSGCCFKIIIPELDENQVIPGQKPGKEHNPGKEIVFYDRLYNSKGNLNGSLNKNEILIVEDNVDILKYLKDTFSEEFIVYSCNNGIQAQDILSEKNIDLVISDIMMPEMDGIELCKWLKSSERTCHIPIILLTAKASEEDIVEGIGQGADDYVVKPFNLKELKARAINTIKQRQVLRQRFTKELDTIVPENLSKNILDQKFMKKAISIVETCHSNPDFGTQELVNELGISRSLTFLKIKKLTGLSPSQFISSIRLRSAARLLKEEEYSISEIAYKVGFNDHTYFNRLFKKTFQLTPSQYRLKKMHINNVRS